VKFLLLIHNTEEGDAALDTEERDRTHAAVCAELAPSGELLDTAPLDYERTLVRQEPGGVAAVTDGPFAEAREIVGGYYLIDVQDRARAVSIAARFVEGRYAPVEVREIATTEPTPRKD
jgi:hypothetical protein